MTLHYIVSEEEISHKEDGIESICLCKNIFLYKSIKDDLGFGLEGAKASHS